MDGNGKVQQVLLITRPQPQAAGFARACAEALPDDAVIVISPVVVTEYLNISGSIPAETALVATSRAAVTALSASGQQHAGQRIYCVGDATASAARALGLQAISAGGNVEDLANLIAWDRPARLLYLRGQDVAFDLYANLRTRGLRLDEMTVYRQTPQHLDAAARAVLVGGNHVICPLMSARTAGVLAAEMPASGAEFSTVAISDKADRAFVSAAQAIARRRIIAQRPDQQSVVAEIARLWSADVA